MNASLKFSETELARLCMEYHVQRLMVFGSALGDAFGPESDIDLLVEFEPDTRAGYFLIIDLQQRLGDLFEREIDLLTPGALNPRYKQSVMASAQVLYERGRLPSPTQQLVGSFASCRDEAGDEGETRQVLHLRL